METSLWEQVGNKCLTQALTLLEKETSSTAATVELVKELVETAISIDTLNLRWAQQNRSVVPEHTEKKPRLSGAERR